MTITKEYLTSLTAQIEAAGKTTDETITRLTLERAAQRGAAQAVAHLLTQLDAPEIETPTPDAQQPA